LGLARHVGDSRYRALLMVGGDAASGAHVGDEGCSLEAVADGELDRDDADRQRVSEREDLLAGSGDEDPLAILREAARPGRDEETIVEVIAGSAPPREAARRAVEDRLGGVLRPRQVGVARLALERELARRGRRAHAEGQRGSRDRDETEAPRAHWP